MGNRWQYTLLMQLSKLICKMSYERILSIGRFLGPAVLQRLPKPRERAASQMMTAMGMTREEVEPLLQKHFEYLGMSAMEIMYTPRLVELVQDGENLEKYIELDHPEKLSAAVDENAGVVGLTAHIGNWEWLGAGLSLAGFPVTTIAKRQPNDHITEMLNYFRHLVGLDVFYSGGSDLISAARAMKQKKILGFLTDKDGGTDGIPMYFLRQMSSVVEGPAVFARRFNAPIVPFFITRKTKDGQVVPGHIIHILEPFYHEETGDQRADIDRTMERMTRIIEDFIYEHPEEWLWVQRRWWTMPEEMTRLTKREEDTDGTIT